MHLQGWHLVIIIVLALLLFAGPKLPKLARSLGQSMRIFKSEVRQMKEDDKPTAGSEASASAGDEPVEGRVIDDGQTGPRA
ncbi:MAG: Sec-independent protein translocase subunit TatA [Arthrobacter sp.]|jgi:sec-independent protein translocase protein TatA|nr:Sec-independent protein translocase subunit TatA [Arthrobacter sp.]